MFCMWEPVPNVVHTQMTQALAGFLASHFPMFSGLHGDCVVAVTPTQTLSWTFSHCVKEAFIFLIPSPSEMAPDQAIKS